MKNPLKNTLPIFRKVEEIMNMLKKNEKYIFKKTQKEFQEIKYI